MTKKASGTFTVKVLPLSPAPAPGLGRFSINKVIAGDLEATTQGEMFSGGDPSKGEAGYIAIDLVTGSLAGKKGSFVLQQMGTMHAGDYRLEAVVAPGSGTEELAGILGTFTIIAQAGVHHYKLEYSLPPTAN